MYNNTKDVKTAIDNTLRVSAPLRPCVKLKNNNAKTQRRDGAKNKSLWVYFTGIFDCADFNMSVDLGYEFGLMTMDSYHVVVMKRLGIKHIASNDSDFERVNFIGVWNPRYWT